MALPLPPLPPTFGGDDAFWHPGGPDVVAVLAEEHRRLAALCRRLAEPPPAPPAGAAGPGAPAGPETRAHRAGLVDVLVAALSRHLSAEEQYLYPALRAHPDGAPVAERELRADAALHRELERLRTAAARDADLSHHAAALGDLLRRHADALAADAFPLLRAVASDADLVRLGNRVEIAEEAAPTRPHPGAPMRPPWNRVVAPLLGVWDKVRDALTRRRTHLRDL
ncbi:MAG TPA: hemerythrin domain-containing protein [Pilimelia sp.]|nr:hemerythrin domain-containing protein [Pilimelia sp.]